MRIAFAISMSAFALVSLSVVAGCGGGGSCAEGATKEPTTGVCMKLPPDFSFEKPSSSEPTSLRVKNAKTFHSITVYLDKPEDLDKQAKTIENMAGGDLKIVAKGDTSPGKGKFFHFHNTSGDYDVSWTLVSTSKHLYRCEIQNEKPADVKAMVEACKSLSGP
jgi:hypothetical protein